MGVFFWVEEFLLTISPRLFFLCNLAFISSHDMSVTGTTDAGQAAALQSAPGVFQIMDMNTPRPSPRREVLGLDYL